MTRELLIRICNSAERFLAASPSSDDVRRALMEMYSSLEGLEFQKTPPSVLEDLSSASAHLRTLGLTGGVPPTTQNRDAMTGSVRAAHDWLSQLPPRGVLDGDRFAVGTGLFLDVLDSSGQTDSFVRDQSERLLRHVEIRQRKALAGTFPEIPSQRIVLEKCDIAIFFSRFSVRHRDLRFLNAALKMNDRFLLRFDRRLDRLALRQRSHFMLSLAEQEFAFTKLI